MTFRCKKCLFNFFLIVSFISFQAGSFISAKKVRKQVIAEYKSRLSLSEATSTAMINASIDIAYELKPNWPETEKKKMIEYLWGKASMEIPKIQEEKGFQQRLEEMTK